MTTLLTAVSYDELALAARLRADWIAQSIARCFEDPSFADIVRDPRRNPCPTLEDAIAIHTSSRTLR